MTRKTSAPKADDLAEFAKGEDVGHGPDHNCAQCRNTRRVLAGGEPLPDYIEAGVRAREADDALEDGRVNPDVVSSTPVPTLAEDLRASIKEHGSREVTGTYDAGVDETEFVRDTRSEMLDDILNSLLRTEMEKQGLRFDPDEIEVIDELVAGLPGFGVMIMKGYVLDDARWHVELVNGVRRAHVAQPERDVAVKLAALTLFNGEKGAQVERRYQELEQANAAAKAAPGEWTGQTQGTT